MSAEAMVPLVEAVRHYLDRAGHVLGRLEREPEAERLLDVRLAPGMFEVGLNLAVAIQFAARALCPPAGREVPAIPEPPTLADLRAYHRETAALLSDVRPGELTRTVAHTAGEAELRQGPADYVARFALPNMIFHLGMAYAGLRHAGMALGKADFDGLHAY